MESEEDNTENSFKDANEIEDTGKGEMTTKKTTRKKPSSGVKKVKPKLRKPSSKKRKKK